MAGFDPLQGQPLEPSGDAPAPAVPAASCPGALQGLSEVPTAVPGWAARQEAADRAALAHTLHKFTRDYP